jgi:ABC-type multidrug transport system ATPase subunit
MSEKILEALMQLFAIITRPVSEGQDVESHKKARAAVVESYLNSQLNQELSGEYLEVFKEHFNSVMEEDAEVARKEKERAARKKESEEITEEDFTAKLKVKTISRRSARVLKLCTSLIEAGLDQAQRIIILFQLLEFVKSGKKEKSGPAGEQNAEEVEARRQENEFIESIASTFMISGEDLKLISIFVGSEEALEDHSSFLIVNSIEDGLPGKMTKHICREGLAGEIWFVHIQSTNMYFMKYMGKGEMNMNGQLLKNRKSYPFNTGYSLRNQQIKPVYFSDVVSEFVGDQVTSKIVFEASHITFRFPNGAIGLHDVGFTEESGRLVGIMGASGAGKSTLLNVLNGMTAPSEGQVLINGIDIHSGDPSIEGIIGFVSQDDLLIEELTVYQNLYYNARLCFDNYTEEQLQEAVDRTLTNLGLYEKKDIQVGSPLNKKISGGQRKRLNIALELIREPAVLFLDEPTSGLSSRDSENILDLLKELTFKGKLVFVVIHQPSSDIFKMFDRLLILDTGGFLIFNGNPVDSIEYFKKKVGAADWNESECPTCGNVNPEQVFNIVETSVLDEFGKLTNTRKIPPEEWSEYFVGQYKESEKAMAGTEDLPEINFKIPGKMKQFGVFFKRDIMKKLKDAQYLAVTFGEAPFLAFILAFIVRYYNLDVSNKFGYTLMENMNMPVYIIMSVIVGIFMGLTVSADEIIKDRKILKREAFLNLSWSSYLMSKVTVQFMISAVQAFTFVIVGNTIMGIRGFYFEYWLVLFSSWAAANVLALLISDSFKTVVTIYILIPILVIPQMILSGIFVKYEEINPLISSPKRIPFYGEMITARWAYEGLATYQFINNEADKSFYQARKLLSIGNLKANAHITSLLNKIDFIERNQEDPGKAQEIEYNLKVLRKEIKDEHKERMILASYHEGTPTYTMKYVDQLYPEQFNQEMLNYTREYLQSLQDFYRGIRKAANTEIDRITGEFDREELNELRRRYTNKRLEEWLTNSKSFTMFTEFKRRGKGDMIQKRDPIYLDPTQKFIKAHFYAPRKQVAGIFVQTLWINVIVIWLKTILIYLLVYYRVLKRIMDFFEQITPKKT